MDLDCESTLSISERNEFVKLSCYFTVRGMRFVFNQLYLFLEGFEELLDKLVAALVLQENLDAFDQVRGKEGVFENILFKELRALRELRCLCLKLF